MPLHIRHCSISYALQLTPKIALLAISSASIAVASIQQQFEHEVKPFLEEHCYGCHDSVMRRGLFEIESMNTDLTQSETIETFRRVYKQLVLEEMPPPKKRQPDQARKQRVINWLGHYLKETQEPGELVHQKLGLPAYGNYVFHQDLFGKRRSHVEPAPPRIWRKREGIYSELAHSAVGQGGRSAIERMANAMDSVGGFNFQDYASIYFIDEATTATLLSNAYLIADDLIGLTHGNLPEKKTKSRARLGKLVLNGEPNRAQVESSVKDLFGLVLFRAPTTEELNSHVAFYGQVRSTSGYITAARLMVVSILLKPESLYRQEVAEGANTKDQHGRVRLSNREIAYALSFALGDEPIDTFVNAQNKLGTQQGIRALLEQQLDDKTFFQRENPRIIQFFREYFNYPLSKEVFKDDRLFAIEGDQLTLIEPDDKTRRKKGTFVRRKHTPDKLVGDVEMFVISILRRDRNVLKELLTNDDYYVDVNSQFSRLFGGKNSGYSKEQVKRARNTGMTSADIPHLFVNPTHAKNGISQQLYYGLPYKWKWSGEKQPYDMSREERAGVLTHPAWLTAWSGNFDNHPVQRGRWIREKLLGGAVPDVPIGVDAKVPIMEGKTLRHRYEVTTYQNDDCWSCHKSMDPLGMPFERYNHYGEWQDIDAGHPVDTSGLIDQTGRPELDGTKVSSPREMMHILANSEYVEQVFVRHVFRFFMGRNETLGDANTLQDAHKAYKQSGGSFRALVISILSSDSFLYRKPVSRPLAKQ